MIQLLQNYYAKNKAMSADNTYHLIIEYQYLLVFDTNCQVHPFIQVMLVYQTSRYCTVPIHPSQGSPAVRLIRLRDLSNGSG